MKLEHEIFEKNKNQKVHKMQIVMPLFKFWSIQHLLWTYFTEVNNNTFDWLQNTWDIKQYCYYSSNIFPFADVWMQCFFSYVLRVIRNTLYEVRKKVQLNMILINGLCTIFLKPWNKMNFSNTNFFSKYLFLLLFLAYLCEQNDFNFSRKHIIHYD